MSYHDPAEELARIDAMDPEPIETINGKPALRLPAADWTVAQFAEELGVALAPHGIFNRQGIAFTVSKATQQLEPARPQWLRSWCEKHVACVRRERDRNGHGWIKVRHTMSKDQADAVLVSPQFLERLRRIERFHPCRMPVLRASGEIDLLPEGFDAESGTYTAENGGFDLEMPPERAKAIIADLFGEFAFAEDGGRSRAVAVAALLTVFGGGIMPVGSTRPIFLYLGNAEGSGKTTCGRLAGIPYGAVPVEAAPASEEEWQKKLLSAVIGGRRILLLDNIKGFLGSPSLEAYRTASRFTGRILGVSKEFAGEASATVLITGNRLTISPDMRRRSLVVELFIHELRAEDRQFKTLLDDPGIISARPSVLAALWSLVREWGAAGRPPASRSNSGFPRWSETIGGIVEHGGFGCPTTPAELDAMGDTDSSDIGRLATVLTLRERYRFADLVGVCAANGLFARFTDGVEDSDTSSMSPADKAKFGKLLLGYDRRTIAPGLTFLVEGRGRDRRFRLRDSIG